MDPRHFDSLVRACAGERTRRRLVAALAALPLAGGLAGLTRERVEAESPRDRIKRRKDANRRKRRNRKRQNNQNNNGKKNHGGGGKLGDSSCVPSTTNNQPTNLQQIINNASPFANIVLCAGDFLADGLSIAKDVSLIGAGTTGQQATLLFGSDPSGGGGTNTSGILGIVSGNVFISNLFIGGANGDVPAIGIEGGTLTLAGVVVGNNSAGGIENLGGTLHLTDGTQVINNGSDAEGGGIMHRGGTTTAASGCSIQNNTATDGGGIFDATGDPASIQLADTFIVHNNTPNNCSPEGTIQNCLN
ncbi:MAG: hypothetical protein JNM64_05110 [Chloroflexia bacterium]|nr:hypothetical protein [Chloroflexia bacterium]